MATAANKKDVLNPIISTRLTTIDRKRMKRVCDELYISSGAWMRQQLLMILAAEEKRLGITPVK